MIRGGGAMKTAFLITAAISFILTILGMFQKDKETARVVVGCADFIVTIALLIEVLILVGRR